MNEDQKRVEEIKARLAKVTPGEWKTGNCCGSVVSTQGHTSLASTLDSICFYGGHLIGESICPLNADFIAHAKSDVEFLLSKLGLIESEHQQESELDMHLQGVDDVDALSRVY